MTGVDKRVRDIMSTIKGTCASTATQHPRFSVVLIFCTLSPKKEQFPVKARVSTYYKLQLLKNTVLEKQRSYASFTNGLVRCTYWCSRKASEVTVDMKTVFWKRIPYARSSEEKHGFVSTVYIVHRSVQGKNMRNCRKMQAIRACCRHL